MDEHELYGLPLDRFVTERTALARALRADGRREQASVVAALRKPSVAAGTVNQLVRTEPDAFAALLDAGDALSAAQERMLEGDGSAEELRDAAQGERAAVETLLAAAGELGMSAAVSERVAGTLHAAALDADARAEVRGGQLVAELAHVGFGGSPGAGTPSRPGAAPEKRASTTRSSKTRPSKEDTAKERADAEARQREERERATRRTQAQRAERDAQRRADTAQRALAKARERRAGAREALDDAERALEDAQTEADAASSTLDDARQALVSLSPDGST